MPPRFSARFERERVEAGARGLGRPIEAETVWYMSRVGTPRDEGFRQPAEWGPHDATWVAWPSDADLWQAELEPARAAFVELCAAIALGEACEILVPGADEEAGARAALGPAAARARFHRAPFGDIWLRDTAPIFVRHPRGDVAAVRFRFNGWGGKYVLEGDDGVSARIAGIAGLRTFEETWVLEGGSVEVDGEGTLLTTRQCLLNPNRNPGMDEAVVTRALEGALGAERVLWLTGGLANDHTDGHVDTLARFVHPGVVVCMEARSAEDPNRDALDRTARELGALTDARGRRLEVVRIPSPGRVLDLNGQVMPASFVNFYVANAAVVVPTYGTPWDEEAATRIGALFPGRRCVPVDARAVLTGGGACHCITQQQPARVAR
jgi:agmatine deiminase